jgi:hypothetical protein
MAALTGSDHGENINDLSTYTFAARAIGPVNSLRTVVAALMWRSANTATVNSVVIGGVTADLVAPFFTAQTGGVVAVANVPSGTTADIVLTLAASCGRAACNVAYSDVMLSHAPVDTAQYLVGGAAPRSIWIWILRRSGWQSGWPTTPTRQPLRPAPGRAWSNFRTML